MKLILFAFLAPLASQVSASALGARAVSNNNCGRAVAGTAKGASFQSTASKDCSANVIVYKTVLVTPSASTFTSTFTAQATAYSTQTAVSTGSTTSTSTIQSTKTFTGTATDYSTSTDTETSTISVTTTPGLVVTSVITVTSASTVTLYTPTAPAIPITSTPAKRNVQGGVNLLQERVTSAASQTIPAYASACTNFAEYAAACSVIGIVSGTSTVFSTVPVGTVTVVVSSTFTSTISSTTTTESDLPFTATETSVSSTTASITETLTATSTTFATAVATVTADSSISYVYQTVTVPGTAVPTVVVPIPNFKLAMVPVAGGPTLYMMALIGDGVVSKGTTDITQASVYTVDTLNRLITTAADPEIACESSSIANYYISNVRPSFLNSHPSYQAIFKPLTCTVNSDATLTCTYKTATAFTLYNNQWFYSTPNYNGYPTYVAHLIPAV